MKFYYKTDYDYLDEMKSYDEDFWYDHDEYEEDGECCALGGDKNKSWFSALPMARSLLRFASVFLAR